MDEQTKATLAGILDKPLASLTVREAVIAMAALDDITDEELAELGLPAGL